MKTKIAVTSASFSRNEILCRELEQAFPEAVIQLNSDGLSLKGTDLIAYLAGADAAIVALEPVDANVIGALPSVRMISKFGVGLDNVDTAYAEEKGIAIGWVGGVNRRSVSELTLAFMLGLSRNVFTSGYSLKAGTWNKHGGMQLTGKTVGILGCGNIGEDVLRLLQPFRVRALVNDILDKSVICECYGAEQVSFESIIEEADFVTVHLPLTEQTEHLFNDRILKRMKSTAYLINTARGPVVDQQALKQALMNGDIAGAALDVYESEPPTDLEFLELSNLMVTPHIGGNAREAVLNMGRSAIQNLVDFFQDKQGGVQA